MNPLNQKIESHSRWEWGDLLTYAYSLPIILIALTFMLASWTTFKAHWGVFLLLFLVGDALALWRIVHHRKVNRYTFYKFWR